MNKPPAEIKTERLMLRKLCQSDAKAIFDVYAQDPEVTRFLTWQPHHCIKQTRAFLTEKEKGWDKAEEFTWAAWLDGCGLIGDISLRINDFKVNIGYVLARAHWNRGYATEIVKTMVAWCLSQSRIYRVWAVCDVKNAASARVLEKAGMQKEGVLRRWILHPGMSGEPRDCYCYSVVK